MESGERKKSERKLVWRDRRESVGMERERPGREKEIRKWVWRDRRERERNQKWKRERKKSVNMIEREREKVRIKKRVKGLGEK